MASDHEERKHRRSSDDESEEPSKRRKHRHHRKRHHRHHSRKHDKRDEGDDDASDMPPPPPPPSANSRPDSDMEEGEIVEEDRADVGVKKTADSDAESGEIKTETNEPLVVPNHTLDKDTNLSTENNDNGYIKGGGNGIIKNHDDEDHETRAHKKLMSNENHSKVHKDSSRKHERSREDVSATSRSRSHDKGRERSRSRSISRLETHREDTEYYTSKKHSRDGESERTKMPLKERERSSSRSRHSLQVDKHGERFREGSRERDRERGRDYRESERDRERDRDRGRDFKESERDRDRGRDYKESERDRDRGRGFKESERDRMKKKEAERYRDMDRDRDRRERDRWDRDRTREKDMERESSRSRRNNEYNDRNNDYKHHRDEERDYKDSGRKYEGQKGDSFKADVDKEKTKREDVDEENYQEKSSLQIEEDEEEEDINRIKEESRRRRQAILEKYKTKSLKQQEQVSQLDDNTPKVNSGNIDGQGDMSDSNTGDTPFSVGRSPPQNGVERPSGTGGLGEGTPKSERSNGDDIFGESPPRPREMKERTNDMFSDDIFGESPTGVRKPGKGDGMAIQRSGLQDNWDDAEGYYSYRFGEILDSRYEVLAAHGKGVFSTVVRAKDLKAGPTDPEEVAIKIIRNNDKMYKAGLEELVILKKLVGADMEDRRHCVRFMSSFKYRNHLCLVFESLHMNLREVLKKFGRNIGLKLTAVRAYAKQLFIALKHLRNCGVLHTDIKPDNMLVNDAKNVLKLCDFGNAMFAGKNEITPYLVSRFYRAPEIILGLTYDHPVDMWSVGCCLFELYSGKVLFPGATNNDMLRLHMELKGPFPKKMLRKGAFTEQHFDQDLNFVAIEEDPVTKKTVKRLVNMKPKDISAIIVSSPGEDPKMVANFKDLLEKIFILDPDKRLTVHQALSHPFITGK